MAADLDARAVGPDAVGVVDDGGGEPQHAPLHAVEGGEVHRPGRVAGDGHARAPAPRLRRPSSSAHPRVLATCSGVSHARRAVATP